MAAVVAVPFWLAGTFAVSRSAFHYSVRRRRRQLEALIERLAVLTRELTPGTPALRAGERRVSR
jgi:Flp pilus assembly protein TadB